MSATPVKVVPMHSEPLPVAAKAAPVEDRPGDFALFGPGIRLRMFRPEKAFWNPDQENKMRGQTIESVRLDDRLIAVFFPRIGGVRIRAKSGKGPIVWSPFAGSYHAVEEVEQGDEAVKSQ